MSILFKDLKIGDKFHLGKSKGAGIHSHELHWEEFEKISPSKARVIKQVNYGNTRGEGRLQQIFPNNIVFLLEK